MLCLPAARANVNQPWSGSFENGRFLAQMSDAQAVRERPLCTLSTDPDSESGGMKPVACDHSIVFPFQRPIRRRLEVRLFVRKYTLDTNGDKRVHPGG